MGDIDQKRDFVMGLYPTSPGWTKRVLKMSEPQVVAIYLREKNKPAANPEKQAPNHNEGNDNDEIPF